MDKEREKGFVQGIALAVALLIRMHDEPTYAIDVLKATGLTKLSYLIKNEVDEYDLEILRPLLEEIKHMGV